MFVSRSDFSSSSFFRTRELHAYSCHFRDLLDPSHGIFHAAPSHAESSVDTFCLDPANAADPAAVEDIHLKGFELTAVNANNQSLKGFESQKDWKFFIV